MKLLPIAAALLLAHVAAYAHDKPPAPVQPVQGTANLTTSAQAGAVSESAALGVASTGPVSSTATSAPSSASSTTGPSSASTGPVTINGDTQGGSSTRALALAFPSINFGSASAAECFGVGPDGRNYAFGAYTSTKPAAVEPKVCNYRALQREAAAMCLFRTAAFYGRQAAVSLGASVDDMPPIPEHVKDLDPLACLQPATPKVAAAPPPAIVVPAPVVHVTTSNAQATQQAQEPPKAPARPPKARVKQAPCPHDHTMVCLPPSAVKGR